MADKREFASTEWVEAMREVVLGLLGGVDLSGIAFAFCEEYTDPPEDLRTEGEESIGWYLRIANGTAEVGAGVFADADFTVIADYQTVLPLARSVFAGDLEAGKQAAKVMQEAAAAGKMSTKGVASSLAERLPQLAGLHDEIARRTL